LIFKTQFIARYAGVTVSSALLFCLPARAQGPVPVGELFASDVNGQKSLQLAGSGMSVVSGSDLSAGIAPATLKLYRGGEVRICPHSGLNVSAGGRGLTLATGTGSLEVDYELTQDSADILITPDFNITLAGPGKFHFALGVNKNGNTCMKPLPGHASEIALAESMGTGTYKAEPGEAVIFLAGKLDQHSDFTGECGCPAPPAQGPQNQRAAETPAPAAPVTHAAAQPTPTPAQERPVELAAAAANTSAAGTSTDHPAPVHVQVDTPFVFSARPSSGQPYSVAKIQISTLPNVIFLQEQVDPVVLPEKKAEVSQQAQAEPPRSAEKPKKEKRGFWGGIKGFFGSIFHR
jgi:hypothetical protein